MNKHIITSILGCKTLGIIYDTDYGVDKKSGWSIAMDGVYCVSFEPSLIKAMWRTFRVAKKQEESASYEVYLKHDKNQDPVEVNQVEQTPICSPDKHESVSYAAPGFFIQSPRLYNNQASQRRSNESSGRSRNEYENDRMMDLAIQLACSSSTPSD